MHIARHRLFKAILLTVSLGLSLSAGRTVLELWKRRDVVRDREGELTRIREENKALGRTLQDMQGEEYVERIARDKLGLIRAGETVVIMPEAGVRGPSAAQGEQRGDRKSVV